MEKVQLKLVLSSPSPKRWKLYLEDDSFVGSIGYKTKRHFYLTDKWLNREKLLSDVLDFEKSEVRSQLFGYLARSEQAPKKVKDWLKKRNLSNDLIDQFIEEAETKGFLSSQRYGEMKLRTELRKGNKPLWRIKLDLQNQGIDSDQVNFEEFNERDSLFNYVKKNRWKLSKDRDKFIKRLMGKGFSYSLILSVLKDVEEDNLG